MEVYISGKKISLKPKQAIGKGGEADVFDIGGGRALKVFKQPDHSDYQGLVTEQKAASDRLTIHQSKLPAFPQNLPQRVIKPEHLATDRQENTILGYAMPLLKGIQPLLKYSDRNFRTSSGLTNSTVISIFRDLHDTVTKIHGANVAIGDFNDLNVLILKDEAYFIDADSFQYDHFLCTVFTSRFVDPLLCDPLAGKPVLQQPHNANSDWYAFAVMLMQSLLFVDPYGGVYKPKDVSGKIPHDTRPLKRITIFHPEVKYPKPAIPYSTLSDDLLHYFHRCFERDERGQFPIALLESIHWQKCPSCGLEHVRSACPICHSHVTVPLKSQQILSQIIQGSVIATQVFQTQGVILCATLDGNVLKWLYYDQGEFKREDGSLVLRGDRDPQMRFWLHGQSTLVGKQGQVIALSNSANLARLAVDSYQDLPVCDRNAFGRYWLHNGQLMRDGKLGEEYIGDVLVNQTQFWVGSHFGFGFYRAGNLHVAFVFDAKGHGINDNVKLPAWQGQLVDADCVFSTDLCWLFLAVQEQGKMRHHVYVIRSNGEVIAAAIEEPGSGSWLTNIHGKYAAGDFLLAATDEGIVRIEPHRGQIMKVKEFPNTEPFVDANCSLYASTQGLYVINRNEIHLLKII